MKIKTKVFTLKNVFYTSLCLFIYSVLIVAICAAHRGFGEWYCRSISSFFRWIFSFLTGFYTFSLAEVALFAVPLILIIIVYFTVKAINKERFSWKKLAMIFLTVIFTASFEFINNFAVCYVRNPIEKNLNIDKKPLTREDVYLSTEYLYSLLDDASENVDFSEDGASVNPHSWSELDKLVDMGYDKLCNDYEFVSKINSKPKKIMLSPVMTYTHISGMYMPFTGEANINTNYPDYVVVFTVAHEKAHQRGIANEDEANFVAFMALTASGDDYLEYSALMNMYDYFLNSAYEHDEEMYYYFMDNTNEKIFGEMYSYYVFFEKYSESRASKVADSVNDSYLKSMGDDDGVESYGKVVELFSAYVDKNKGLPY